MIRNNIVISRIRIAHQKLTEMKRSLLLIFTLMTFTGFCQTNSSSCYIIVVKSGENKTAHIDSLYKDQLHARHCPDMKSPPFQVKLKHIQYIVPAANPPEDMSYATKATIYNINKKTISPKGLKRWWFNHKTKKIKRSLTEGQSVKIYYQGRNNRTELIKGKWKGLTEENVLVYIPRKTIRSIPKKDIIKIKANKSFKGTRDWVLISLILGITVVLWILVAVAYVDFKFFQYFGGDPNLRSDAFNGVGGCLIPIIFSIGLVAFLFISRFTINTPFDNDWTIDAPMLSPNDSQSLYEP